MQRVRRAECFLERMELVGRRGQAFNGMDLVPARLHREHQARAHRQAVEQNGARAAHAVLAADVGAGEPEVVAQEVGELQPRLHFALMDSVVDGGPDFHDRETAMRKALCVKTPAR